MEILMCWVLFLSCLLLVSMIVDTCVEIYFSFAYRKSVDDLFVNSVEVDKQKGAVNG